MTKAKISVTIDKDLADEIDTYHRKLVVEAAKSGKSIPRQSNVYEEIVRRGWEVLKKEKNVRQIVKHYSRPTDQTSRRMKQIKSRETELEKRMEAALKDAKFLYEKQPKLVGHPDFRIKGTRIVVFCDSSFWHGRRKKDLAGTSFTRNKAFWMSKIVYNKKRDAKVNAALEKAGWTVLRFWDDEILRRPDAVAHRIGRALSESTR